MAELRYKPEYQKDTLKIAKKLFKCREERNDVEGKSTHSKVISTKYTADVASEGHGLVVGHKYTRYILVWIHEDFDKYAKESIHKYSNLTDIPHQLVFCLLDLQLRELVFATMEDFCPNPAEKQIRFKILSNKTSCNVSIRRHHKKFKSLGRADRQKEMHKILMKQINKISNAGNKLTMDNLNVIAPTTLAYNLTGRKTKHTVIPAIANKELPEYAQYETRNFTSSSSNNKNNKNNNNNNNNNNNDSSSDSGISDDDISLSQSVSLLVAGTTDDDSDTSESLQESVMDDDEFKSKHKSYSSSSSSSSLKNKNVTVDFEKTVDGIKSFIRKLPKTDTNIGKIIKGIHDSSKKLKVEKKSNIGDQIISLVDSNVSKIKGSEKIKNSARVNSKKLDKSKKAMAAKRYSITRDKKLSAVEWCFEFHKARKTNDKIDSFLKALEKNVNQSKNSLYYFLKNKTDFSDFGDSKESTQIFIAFIIFTGQLLKELNTTNNNNNNGSSIKGLDSICDNLGRLDVLFEKYYSIIQGNDEKLNSFISNATKNLLNKYDELRVSSKKQSERISKLDVDNKKKTQIISKLKIDKDQFKKKSNEKLSKLESENNKLSKKINELESIDYTKLNEKLTNENNKLKNENNELRNDKQIALDNLAEKMNAQYELKFEKQKKEYELRFKKQEEENQKKLKELSGRLENITGSDSGSESDYDRYQYTEDSDYNSEDDDDDHEDHQKNTVSIDNLPSDLDSDSDGSDDDDANQLNDSKSKNVVAEQRGKKRKITTNTKESQLSTEKLTKKQKIVMNNVKSKKPVESIKQSLNDIKKDSQSSPSSSSSSSSQSSPSSSEFDENSSFLSDDDNNDDDLGDLVGN